MVQSLAEALGVIALFQSLRPGAPCVIGTFTSNVDPSSGAQQIQHYMQPQICATGPAEIALDTVRVLGTTGRLPGLSPERQGDGVYRPILSDWRGYEDWQRGGGLWVAERAHLLFRQILADFAPPPKDPAIREELGDFVARRRRAHAAPADA